MFKDTLNSLLDNVKERTTNPFLGTFIVVWIIKNWMLVYSLFYFDKDINLTGRLEYIRGYFNTYSFFWNTVFVTLITLGVLVLTYLLLAASRLLTDFYDRIVIPNLSKLTDKNSIVLKIDYLKLEETIKLLQERLDQERQAKAVIQDERDRLDVKLTEKIKSDNKYFPVSKPDEQISPEFNEQVVGYKKVLDKVLKQSTYVNFNSTVDRILAHFSLNEDDELVKLLLREGLIKYVDRSHKGNTRYALTDYGDEFLKYWNQETSDES